MLGEGREGTSAHNCLILCASYLSILHVMCFAKQKIFPRNQMFLVKYFQWIMYLTFPPFICERNCRNKLPQARFKRRISAMSNAIQTKGNEANHLIIYCLNCIRHGRNATYEPGLRFSIVTHMASQVVTWWRSAKSIESIHRQWNWWFRSENDFAHAMSLSHYMCVHFHILSLIA